MDLQASTLLNEATFASNDGAAIGKRSRHWNLATGIQRLNARSKAAIG